MRWVCIDADAPLHVKQLRAGNAACWLWVCGLAYSQRSLTNGFIPLEVLPFLGVTGDVLALAERLVEAGLWERTESGFRVHDYLEYQQSREDAQTRAEQISSIRRAAANQRWSKHRASAMQAASKADANALQTDAYHTIPNQEEKKDTHAPKSDERPKAKGHRGHFFCGHRLCVPQFIWEEFDRQLGGADMVKAQQWLKKLDQRVTDSGEVIEDPLKFVREAFKQLLVGSKRHGYVHVETDDTLNTCPHEPHCTSSRACRMLRDLEAMKEKMRHEGTDSPLGRQVESAPVETGRSYSVRDSDSGSVRRT